MREALCKGISGAMAAVPSHKVPMLGHLVAPLP